MKISTKARLDTLVSNMPPELDGILITSGVNRRYYTGFPSSAGTLLVTRQASTFVIDSRYFEAAQAAIGDCTVVLQGSLYQQIQELCGKQGAKTLGIESESVSVGDYLRYQQLLPGLELPMDSGVSAVIEKQRRVKSRLEIDSMQAAQRIAEDVFRHICTFIGPGVSELQIDREMSRYARELGSEANSFSYIVASGPNGSRPHAVPGERKIEKGDLITMDYGCMVDGYCSDMTRTVAVGQVSAKQREVYDLVLQAQIAALAVIKPSMVCRDVDKVARDMIDATEYKGLFGHGLGHSLGLEVHENPRFSPADDTVLEPGFVLSVEPGVYVPGELGVRIEDVIVVTEDGHRNLMTLPKEMLVL